MDEGLKQQYGETVQKIKDLINDILNNNVMTTEDMNTLELLKQQEQQQYTDLKYSNIDEEKTPITKEDLINILTDFGKSTLFHLNEDGTVDIGGQNIPELNECRITVNTQKKQIESLVSEGYVEVDGEKKKLSVAYSQILQDVNGISENIVNVQSDLDSTTVLANNIKDTAEEHSQKLSDIEEHLDESDKSLKSLTTKYNEVKDTTEEHSQTIKKIEEGVIKNITNQYYLSTSTLKLAGGSWKDELPSETEQEGKYLWFRTVTSYTNENMPNVYGTPICTQGANGAQGVAGKDGTSIIFKGSFDTVPTDPKDGWAYYNKTDKKSYVYQDSTWYQMSIDGIDGKNGEDGKSMYYKGKMSTPPSNPELNWCYKDSDNGIVYIYNGTSWEIMTRDGNDGADGTDGINGWNVYITYNDSTSQPSRPTSNGTSNGWHTDTTSSVIWMSQKVAQDQISGTWSYPMKIKGDKGIDGADGTDGSDGRSVTSTVPQYAWDSSSTYISPNDSTWSNSMPTYSSGRNLWIRQKVTYSDGTTVYTEPTCDPSWKAMKDCYTSYTQLDDKFSWLVKSGSSSSNFEITDRLASLVTNKVIVNAKSMELTGSININNGTFKVATNGNTKIGGSSEYSIEGYSRAKCEITSSGSFYNVGSSSSYTKIDDGKLHCTQSSRNLDFDSSGLQITYGSSSTDYLRLNEDGLGSGDNSLKLFNNNNTLYLDVCSNYGTLRPSSNGGCRLGDSSYGWGYIYSKFSLQSSSDRTLKENINYIKDTSLYSTDITNEFTYQDFYDFVKDDLYLATYNFIDDETKSKSLNFIAQDILYNEDETDNKVGQLICKLDMQDKGSLTFSNVNYNSVIAGALKQSINKIETLEEEVKLLKQEIEELKNK